MYDIDIDIPRMAEETAQAYRGFLKYVSLPSNTKNKNKEVAVALGVTAKVVADWKRKFLWNKRIKVYKDKEQERLLSVELLSPHVLPETTRHRHLDHAVRLQHIAMKELLRVIEESKEEDSGISISPKDLIKMLEVGFKHERLVNGDATDVLNGSIDVPPLTEDEVRAFMKVIEDA